MPGADFVAEYVLAAVESQVKRHELLTIEDCTPIPRFSSRLFNVATCGLQFRSGPGLFGSTDQWKLVEDEHPVRRQVAPASSLIAYLRS